MHRLRKPFLLLSCVSSLVGAQTAATAQRDLPDSVAVRRRASEIIEADNRRDLERVMDSYTADAVLMPPDGREVVGRLNIRPRYKTLFDENQPELRTTIDEIVIFCDWAMVRGRNTGSFKPLKGGNTRRVSDVYTEILRKDRDGQWRIARLMWHAAAKE